MSARRLALLPLLALALAALLPMPASARKPAEVLKGRIILSPYPFPFRFKSDKQFISHMRKVDTKGFRYEGADTIPVNMMVFLKKAVAVTELTATLYDTTDPGKQTMVHTFPIYLPKKKERVIASDFELEADAFEEEHSFLLVVTHGYRGQVLAKTDFAIKKSKGNAKAAPAGATATPEAPKPAQKPEPVKPLPDGIRID